MQNDAKKEQKKAQNKASSKKNVSSKKSQTSKKGGAKASASKSASSKSGASAKKSARKSTAQKSRTSQKQKTQKSVQKPKRTAKKKAPATPVKVSFLGGLNEIGKNLTVYETDEDIIVVDCGLAFPEQDMLGIDLVIPDFSYLKENLSKVRGVFITHGHEDHIGAIPYLLREINVPVYGTRLTMGLIEGKLEEHKLLSSAVLNVIKPGDTIKAGGFSVEAIHVNHSIPDALGFAITCNAGTIVQTGDFKIDSTPIDGGMIDINRFGELGSKGVLCMLSDSTNAERPGYTASERNVGNSLETLFSKAGKRRIIIATFASNVHRVQQIINVAKKLGRKVALSGRSLENVMKIGTEMGYLNVDDGQLVSIDMIKEYPEEQMVIITTGSQGEPMSALSRMAFSDHRKVNVGPNDYVIISATPIPGNEKTVGNVINELMKLGAEVIYERTDGIHVSGHACQEELKLMLGVVRPQFFIPVHGEQKHLRKHAMLAEAMGIAPQNIYVADNGVQVEISKDGIKELGQLPMEQIFVDGSGVGDVGNIVINDRKRLSENGIVVVVVSVDSVYGEIVSGPEIISRGFIYVRENEQLIEEAKIISRNVVEDYMNRGIRDWPTIKNRVRDAVSRYMYEKTGRNPMILSIIMEV
ncbi:MAG: ribonuclease J [Clostridia bacterium]|nr:ribonuclease J [Clostridia bacterium]